MTPATNDIEQVRMFALEIAQVFCDHSLLSALEKIERDKVNQIALVQLMYKHVYPLLLADCDVNVETRKEFLKELSRRVSVCLHSSPHTRYPDMDSDKFTQFYFSRVWAHIEANYTQMVALSFTPTTEVQVQDEQSAPSTQNPPIKRTTP